MAQADEFEVSRPDSMALRRILPVSALVLVEAVIGVAVVALAFAGLPWWIGVVAGAVVSLPALVRVGGVSPARRVAARMGYLRRRGRRSSSEPEPPFDVPMSEGGSCGMRWDGGRLITMIRVDADPRALTRFVPGHTITDDVVPLDLIAECLTQFDIVVDSIDVLSRGSRAWGSGPIAEIYRRILGPLPATAFRSVVVVIRIDPLRNAPAVQRRGGGSVGALRTAAVATRRVATRLTGRGRASTILTAAECTAQMAYLTDGVDVADVTERWDHVSTGRTRACAYRLDDTALTSAGVTAPWTVQSVSTVVALHMRRGDDHEDAAGDQAQDQVVISALARFITGADTEIDVPPGFHRLDGRQRMGLTGTLPLADPFGDRDGWEYRTTVGSLRALPVPAAGCGQLVGADADGRAVALPLVGSSVRTVEIAGSLHLGQQVILRALALGARVMVTSDRPTDWTRMTTAVGDPHMLTVAGAAAGSQVAGARQGFSVLVFDGVTPPFQSAEVTTIALTDPGVTPSEFSDVALTQSDDSGWVTVRSGGESIRAMMVATAEELRFIGYSVGVGRGSRAPVA